MSRDKFRLLLIKILTLFIAFFSGFQIYYLLDSKDLSWIWGLLPETCGFSSSLRDIINLVHQFQLSSKDSPPPHPTPFSISFFFFFFFWERRPSRFDCLLLTKVNLIYHSTLSAYVIILLTSNSNAMLSTKIIHTIFLKLMAC